MRLGFLYPTFYKVLIFIILPLSLSQSINAQIKSELTQLNLDSIFTIARDSAYTKNYMYSRDLCDKVLKINPAYLEVKIFKGRTYAWEQKYDSARAIFKEVWIKDSSNTDLLEAYIDLETWSNRTDTALKLCDSALYYHPGKNEFLNRKAKLLITKNLLDEAKTNLEKSLEQNPNDTIALQLLNEIKNKNFYKNRISLEFSVDYFDNPYLRRWQMLGVNYMRKFKKSVLIGKFIQGFLHTTTEDAQSTIFEVEWYPQIDSNRTGFFTFGISKGFPFPVYRGGFEIYQRLKNNFEASLGARYMHYSRYSKSKDVFTITGSIGKYLGNFFFSFRPYLTPYSDGTSKAYVLLARYYLPTPDSYVFAEYNWGEFPEEPSNVDLNKLKINIYSKIFKTGVNLRIKKVWWLYSSIGIGTDELDNGLTRKTALFEFKIGYYF